jgi:hypothetical protein
VYLSLWLSVSISLSISMSPSLPPSLTVYPIELYPSLSPLPLPLPLLSIYLYIYLSIGRTQYFATFLPFRALLSSFYWLSLSLSYSFSSDSFSDFSHHSGCNCP